MGAPVGLFPELAGDWEVVRDGNPEARVIFMRHYSYRPRAQRSGANFQKFMGPGEHLILLSWDRAVLFAWRRQQHRKDGQQGIECAIFRNESKRTASELILSAERLAFQRWGQQRLFTFVNPDKIQSVNPGYCFKRVGWKSTGISKGGLLVLAKELRP